MTPVNILDISRREDFRKWLMYNHHTEKECWVSVKRGKTPPENALWYLDAVECSDSSKYGTQTICPNDSICVADTCCTASPEEIAGIRKTLDLYAEAAIKGDSKIARNAFASTATMSYAEGDSLVSVPIQALYDYYDQTGPHNATYEISACNVADDVAIVRIESKFGEAEFSDMFTLVKDGSDWKIVSKVYHMK